MPGGYAYNQPRRTATATVPAQTTTIPPAPGAAPGTPDQTVEWPTASAYDPAASTVSRPGYGAPPLGFPMPTLRVKLVGTDEWGGLYADERGFMWREPSFRPRFDQLKAADPTLTGGWMSGGPIQNWFRSRNVNPEYAPSALDQLLTGGGDAAGAGLASAKTLGLFALAGGALYAAAPYLRKLGK